LKLINLSKPFFLKSKADQLHKVYTKPHNPNTPEQQKTRITFANLTRIGNALKEPLLLYARPATPKMTAANRIMSLNRHMFGKTGTGWDPEGVVIMTGDLPATPIFEGYIERDMGADHKTIGELAWDRRTETHKTDGFLAAIFDNETKKVVYTTYTGPGDPVYLSPPITVYLDITDWTATSSLTDVYGFLAFFKINEDGSGINSITSTTKCIEEIRKQTPKPPPIRPALHQRQRHPNLHRRPSSPKSRQPPPAGLPATKK
jgi:hypothetical protein